MRNISAVFLRLTLKDMFPYDARSEMEQLMFHFNCFNLVYVLCTLAFISFFHIIVKISSLYILGTGYSAVFIFNHYCLWREKCLGWWALGMLQRAWRWVMDLMQVQHHCVQAKKKKSQALHFSQTACRRTREATGAKSKLEEW